MNQQRDAGVADPSVLRAFQPNADLLLPYLLPYGAYVGIAMLAGELGSVLDYTIRIVISAGLLGFLWRRYQPLAGPRPLAGSILVGALAGLVGVLVWIALLLPFQHPSAGTAFSLPEFLLRLAAAVVIVPIVEELLFRGYLLGLITQWQEAGASGAGEPLGVALDHRSVREIPGGAWTWLAVVLSSAAFALGHSTEQWLAAFGYGLIMAGLWILRRDLVAPITAHAVTNLVLYLYVFATGSWGLW